MLAYSYTYGDLEYFLLILVRVTAFVYVCPFFSQSGVPQRVKAGFSICLSLLLYATVDRAPIVYDTLIGYTVLIFKEAAVGIILGFAAVMCNAIMGFAGHIVDMQTGLSMVSMMDPASRQSVTITGALYTQVLMVMLLISGMYQYILQAIADSYQLIPVAGAVIHSDLLAQTAIRFLSNYIIIGFRITLPVFIITFVMNIILGVLAKVSPQLNMFAVGIQIKILVGMSIMFLTCGMLAGASNFIFVQTKNLMQEFVQALH